LTSRAIRGSVATVLAALAVIVLGPRAGAAVTPVDCPTDDLQAAIGAAAGGDTLQISGTCTGNFTIASKSLILQGSTTPSSRRTARVGPSRFRTRWDRRSPSTTCW
jgi:nitrous oxidase accessory protein NosD